MRSHTQNLNPPQERKKGGITASDARPRTETLQRRLTNTTMTLIWSFSWPNLRDKGNKCLCAARLPSMVVRQTSSHQFQCSNARACACMCVAQNVDMLWFPDGSFCGIQRRVLEQILRNLPSCLSKCHLTALPRSRIVPATTNLCLFSHFPLPFHFAWYRSLCTSKQRHHKC